MSLTLFASNFLEKSKQILKELESFEDSEKIELINQIRKFIHERSPFKNEPVDYIQWVESDLVKANDYNPNIVAPPEMRLLEHSILEDGYTQPIVTWINNGYREVVDGFHRNRVGKECSKVRQRILNYLPVTTINENRLDRGDRIAATIRHNRARGKHNVEGMSEIVVELKNRNWSNERIGNELGMEPDEILRLCQISGIAELFADQEFSKAWDIEVISEDYSPLTDDVDSYGEETDKFRTVNTNDEKRIFHTWDKWECFKAGFYATTKEGMTRQQCEEAYKDFLSNIDRFSNALNHVITEWKYSCEHYLTNSSMNRIAWLGQAAMCYEMGIPAVFRGGFYLLTEEQQAKANETAFIYLNKWLEANGRNKVTIEEALSGKQMDLY